MVENEEQALMVKFDFLEAWNVFLEYFFERLDNFQKNGNIEIVEILIEFFFVYIGQLPGKLSLMSPWFIGIFYVITVDLTFAQALFNLFINEWFAHGSLILVGSQIFTYVQCVLMSFLLWNFQFYLYDFRMVRYVSLITAITFILGYVMVVAKTIELYFIKAGIEDDVNFIDVIQTLILAYISIIYSPTFLINLIIFLKELTLNQLAWSADEDFADGTALFGTINIDILYWLGINEDYHWYIEYLKKWT